MNKQDMVPNLTDRLRGMILFSAFGDALGANHETTRAIYPPSFPGRLLKQRLDSEPAKWGYWITKNESAAPVKGVPTDDTSFKLFILHPWLQQVLVGKSDLAENAFRQFIVELKSNKPQPAWIVQPRNAQIDSWLDMYRGFELHEEHEFFTPNVPVVFGFFLFLELAAIRDDYDPVGNYLFFRTATVLDQGYAKSATGFLAAIASQAFSAETSKRFDHWLVSRSLKLANELIGQNVDQDDVLTIRKIVETMSDLGERMRGKSPYEFVAAFEQSVVVSPSPPFMNEPFKNALYDPFRMLAEIYAAAVYAEGDPNRSIRPFAFGSGDSDTVCTFFGTLLGIWFGENQLRQNEVLDADLTNVEKVLQESFDVNLYERVELFMQLRSKDRSQFVT